MKTNNKDTFFSLLKAGLFSVHGERNSELRIDGTMDWDEVYQLAQEQSVQGIVLQGIEWFKVHDSGFTIPQVLLLEWIGEVQMIEQQNKEMNKFIASLVQKLQSVGIYSLLVKGQGVAQCYERPMWRASGDVDLLLDSDNYNAAKSYLIPEADEVAKEDIIAKHQALVIKGFDVELHGKMPFSLSKRADAVIDSIIGESFVDNNNDKWIVGDTVVPIPSPDNHVVLVFTHFLHHFFIEGVGLRQICDWCRLLYTYKDSLDYKLLESRIRKMRLTSEWKAFYNLASRYLGMPDLDSELTIHDSRFDKKADRVMELVLESGNFGHNKDLSYRTRYSGMTYKIVAARRRLKDFASLIPVFPLDAPRFFWNYMLQKVKA